MNNREERIKILRDKFNYKGPVEFDENDQLIVRLFNCNNTGLTSLEGAPDIINGNFHCDNNNMIDLSGAPKIVKYVFYCNNCNLKSLNGAPYKIGINFSCTNNELTSLEGAPRIVGGDFYCQKNKFTSLNGIPKQINGSFVISVFPNTPLLKILNVNGIKRFFFFLNNNIHVRIQELEDLFNEYYGKGSKGQLQCGIEMIRLGYKSNAKL